MKYKHTPGEWHSKRNGRFMPMDGWSADHEDFTFCAAAPIKADGKVVAIVVDGRDEFDLEMAELKANAILIAAAPDLLEALQAALDYGSMTGASWIEDKALAAIAKATGTQP